CAPARPVSGDQPVDLEHLGVLAVDVDAVGSCEVPDVLRVGVPPVLLRGVLRERRLLALDVARLEREVRLVREVEVVPRDLVAEDRRPLERAQPLGRDRLVVLVDVVKRRLEDGVGSPLVPQLDQELEDLLAMLRERADVEVVDGQVRGGDAELRRRFAHLSRERVRREPLRQRPGRDRERDVAHLRALLDQAGHGRTAAELAVVGVRREHEDALPRVHSATAARAATAVSASAPQNSGSWNSASSARLSTTIAAKASPRPRRTLPPTVAPSARRNASHSAAARSHTSAARPGRPVSTATVVTASCAADGSVPRNPPVPTPTAGWSSAVATPFETSVARAWSARDRPEPPARRSCTCGTATATTATAPAATTTGTSARRRQSTTTAARPPAPSASSAG